MVTEGEGGWARAYLFRSTQFLQAILASSISLSGIASKSSSQDIPAALVLSLMAFKVPLDLARLLEKEKKMSNRDKGKMLGGKTYAVVKF